MPPAWAIGGATRDVLSRGRDSVCARAIDEVEAREIDTIRRVRNEFADQWEGVSFESGRVKDLALTLPWHGPKEYEPGSTPRSRFSGAAAMLLTDLMWRTRLASTERRKPKKRPNAAR